MTDTAQREIELTGIVLRPGDPGFAAEIAGFNLATTHTPEVVVGATGPADVVAAVRWAAARGRSIAVQATGHGANIAVDGGVLINTRRMCAVQIDPATRTATVGAGATWRDVLAAAEPHGLAGLNGSSSSVGVVGYTTGGGLPVLGRPFGYASDHVRGFEVVTADGRPRHVDAGTEPDLFWALRGGKGNAAVVTSMTFGLVPVARIFGGSVFYPGAAAADLLPAYADWVAGLPEATSTALQLLRLPPFPDIPEPLRGQFVVQLCVAHTGDAAEGAALLAPMRAAARPVVDTVAELPYLEVDRVYQDPDHPMPAREGCVLLRELSAGAIDAVLDLAGPATDSPLLLLALRHLGGALARPPAVPDAVCMRDAGFLAQTVGVLAGPRAADVPAATAAAQEALAPFATGRTTVNLHGTPGDDADRARAWTPEVYERLRRVKQRYDPAGRLRAGHTVPLP
jgi:FAD/FMN-containing dehydrogenase